MYTPWNVQKSHLKPKFFEMYRNHTMQARIDYNSMEYSYNESGDHLGLSSLTNLGAHSKHFHSVWNFYSRPNKNVMNEQLNTRPTVSNLNRLEFVHAKHAYYSRLSHAFKTVLAIYFETSSSWRNLHMAYTLNYRLLSAMPTQFIRK